MSFEENKKLCALVKQCPQLYDKGYRDSDQRMATDMAWRTIAESLGKSVDESNKEVQSEDIGNEELDFGYILQYLLGNMMNDQAQRFFGEILQSMQDSVDHTADITAYAPSIGVCKTKRGEHLAFIEPHMPREFNKELQSGDIGNEELDFGYILQYLLGNMMNDQAHRFFGEILQSMQESNHCGDSVDHTADITAYARSIGVYKTKRGEHLGFIEPHMSRASNKELQSGDIGNEELDFGYILQYLLGNMMNDQAHRFFGEILQSMQESNHCGDSVDHTADITAYARSIGVYKTKRGEHLAFIEPHMSRASNKELQSGDIGNEELDFIYILQYLLGNMMNDQAHRFFGEILQSMQDSVDHTADITAYARSIGVYKTKRGEHLAFIEPHMPREFNKELQSGDMGNEELDFGYILQYLLGNMMNDQAQRFFGEILQSMQESNHCGDSVDHTADITAYARSIDIYKTKHGEHLAFIEPHMPRESNKELQSGDIGNEELDFGYILQYLLGNMMNDQAHRFFGEILQSMQESSNCGDDVDHTE